MKHIGITGLPLKIYSAVLEDVEQHSVDTVLSYCHNTLLDQTLIDQIPYFKVSCGSSHGSMSDMRVQSKGVGVIDASPFAMGLLTPQGAPAWHPAPDEVKGACRAARELCKEQSVSLPRLALYTALQ